jgi:hypothetical protein
MWLVIAIHMNYLTRFPGVKMLSTSCMSGASHPVPPPSPWGGVNLLPTPAPRGIFEFPVVAQVLHRVTDGPHSHAPMLNIIVSREARNEKIKGTKKPCSEPTREGENRNVSQCITPRMYCTQNAGVFKV